MGTLRSLSERCQKIFKSADVLMRPCFAEIVRGKGILIPEQEKIAIRALDDDEQGNKDYVFLPSERVKIMVCYIIHSKSPVYVER